MGDVAAGVTYTPKQAEIVTRSIDIAVARIDDDVCLVKNRVPDSAGLTRRLDGLLEEIHEVAHDLRDLIERRTTAE